MNGPVVTRVLGVLAALIAVLALAPAAEAAYRFETAWGSAGTGAGQFSGPLYVTTGPDASVYVTDRGNNRIEKFTRDGAFLTAWGSQGSGDAQFNPIGGVAVGPDGTVYVVDQGNDRVEHFDANGNFLSQWGTPGTLAGQFNNPVAVATGPDGSVYVADAGNSRVQRFFSNGAFQSAWGSGVGTFNDLESLATGPDGSVYGVDAEPDNRIERFSASGAFVSSWGTTGTGDGQFQAPRGIAAGPQGVYVEDGNERIQRFTVTGAFVDALDGPGTGDSQFSGPWGVGVAPDGKIYVSFNGNSRVARYGETAATTALPPPTSGETANAEPVKGKVRVRKPGSKHFVLLSTAEQIPIGSVVDVRHGTVSLTTTSGTAVFYAGVFQLLQTHAARAVTELRLYGANFRTACARTVARTAARRNHKLVRSLWGDGSGRFRTRGRYASATIRGTQWLTQDRCDGTRVRVKRGAVTVRDLVKRISVIVKAPKSYFVPAPSR